jgi:hypothetical protein
MLRKIAVLTAAAALVACGSDKGSSDDDVVITDASDDADLSEEAGASDAAADAGGAVDAAPDAGGAMDGATADASEDAGADTGPDASSGNDAGDSSMGDATADAEPPDAAPATMFALTVRRGTGSALANAPVYFHDESGAKVGDVRLTDANGRVLSTTAPAMVTIAAPKKGNVAENNWSETRLYTLTALAAGDDVVLELPLEGTAQAGYSVSVQVDTPLAGNPAISKVRVTGGIHTAPVESKPFAQPVVVPWSSTWGISAKNTLLAIAYGANNLPLGYAYSTEVDAFAATPAAVSLSGWKVPQNVALTVKGLAASDFAAGLVLVHSRGAQFDTLNLDAPIALTGTAAMRTANVPTPPGLAEEHTAVVNIQVADHRKSSLAVRGAVEATATIDAAEALPTAVSLTINRALPARPTLSWTNATAPTNAADGTALLVEFPGSAQTSGPSWVIVTPGNVSSVKLPEVPTRGDFITAAPKPSLYISHFASSKIQNYRQFLKEPVKPTIDGESYHLLGRALPAQTSTQAATFDVP